MSENAEPTDDAQSIDPTPEQVQAATEGTPEDLPMEEVHRQQLVHLRTELEQLTLQDMYEATDALRVNNQNAAGQLAAEGMQLDPTMIMMQRIEAIIQFGLSEEDRARVDMMFERQMAGLLGEAAHQARVAKLTQGINGMAPSDILRGGQHLPRNN